MNTYSSEYFENPLRNRYSITAELMIQIKNLPSGSKVLDLGCGDMRLLEEIAKLRPDLVLHGVDVGSVQSKTPKIEFTSADVTTFQANERYQLVLAIDVLEHLTAPEKLVMSARKALAVSGTFYVIAPSVTKCLLFGDENFFSDYSHVRPFNCKSMSRLLLDHGFQPQTVSEVGRGYTSAVRFIYYLFRGIVTVNPRYFNGAIKMIAGSAIEAVAVAKC